MPPRLVPPLAAGTPGDPGLTGPGSVTWRVCRERVVLLGGLSALLLQLAHPLVAAGVAEHSSFHRDPVRRLKRTLELLLVTTFGDVRQVGEMTRRIAGIHRAVSGSLQQDVGNGGGAPTTARPARSCACGSMPPLSRPRWTATARSFARSAGASGPSFTGRVSDSASSAA